MQRPLKTRILTPASPQLSKSVPVKPATPEAGAMDPRPGPITLLQQAVGNRGMRNLIKSGEFDKSRLTGSALEPLPRVIKAPLTALPVAATKLSIAPGGTFLQRFGYQEHQLAGDLATGQKLVLFKGAPGIPRYEISFGEMVALAGDYFESLEQMKELAKTVLGQKKLDYARSKGGMVPEPPDDVLSSDEKRKMDELYYDLNSRNYQHFSEPTVKDNNLKAYLKAHQKIVEGLFKAGQLQQDKDAALKEAMLIEGFHAHFLTDAFCGGHITAPREGADEHWKKIYPLFLDNFFHHISEKVAEYINDNSMLAGIATIAYIKTQVLAEIKKKAPPGIDSYSLGGLISLAVHDWYNERGLDVVSQVDASGNPVEGGYKWKAYGEYSGKTLDKPIAAVQQAMVVAAVKAGIADLEAAYHCKTPEELKEKTGPPFKVERFVPQADPNSASNVAFQWKFNTVDDLVKNTEMMDAIKALLGPNGYVGKMLAGVTADPKMDATAKNGIQIWLNRLWTQTGTVLKEIAEYVPGGAGHHYSTDTMSRDYVAEMFSKNKLQGATTSQMIGLIEKMLDGYTSGEDQTGILRVLQAANQKGNIFEVMKGAGHFWRLEPKFTGGNWTILLAVLSEKYFPMFTKESKLSHVKWLVSNTYAEWGEEACIAILNSANTADFKYIVDQIGKSRLDSFLDGAEQDRFDYLLLKHGYSS
ncbi:MAG: hypothetical protein K6U80_07745 [Firmicutes bacterium]|nr:hypothetical protein [Bacillota bacterium]